MGIRRIYGHLLKSLKTDVALLGPQIKFALPEIKKLTDQAENEFRKSQQPDFSGELLFCISEILVNE